MTPTQHHDSLVRAAPAARLRRLLALISDGRFSALLEQIQDLSADRERLAASADLDDLSDPATWAARVAHLAWVGAVAQEEVLLRFVPGALVVGLVLGALVGALSARLLP